MRIRNPTLIKSCSNWFAGRLKFQQSQVFKRLFHSARKLYIPFPETTSRRTPIFYWFLSLLCFFIIKSCTSAAEVANALPTFEIRPRFIKTSCVCITESWPLRYLRYIPSYIPKRHRKYYKNGCWTNYKIDGHVTRLYDVEFLMTAGVRLLIESWYLHVKISIYSADLWVTISKKILRFSLLTTYYNHMWKTLKTRQIEVKKIIWRWCAYW